MGRCLRDLPGYHRALQSDRRPDGLFSALSYGACDNRECRRMIASPGPNTRKRTLMIEISTSEGCAWHLAYQMPRFDTEPNNAI